jgi:TolB-like protein/Tfp pilus assembly protein PilF
LPFADLSPYRDQEFFCDGFVEELIGALTKLENLRVLAPYSVLPFKGETHNLQSIGKRLGVSVVLKGSIRKEGERVRITAHLVNIRDGSYLWADTYERHVSDTFDIQEEDSRAIVDNLRVKLAATSNQPLVKRYTSNSEAHLSYLKGRHFWNKFTPDRFEKAIGSYQQAIALDAEHAPAFVGLAETYYLQAVFGIVKPTEIMPKAQHAVAQALTIDEAFGDAHRAMALVKAGYEWDWPGAEREFKRAIALNPNDAHTRWAYGHYLAQQVRVEEAIVQMKRAEELDPLSANTVSKGGIPFYIGRQYERAAEQFRKAIELDSNVWYIHEWLGQAYLGMGKFDEAVQALEKSIAVGGGRMPALLAELGRAHALAGRPQQARKLIKESEEEARRFRLHLGAFLTAFVYADLGEKDRAFQLLEKAYQDRYVELVWIKAWPASDKLRSDARFTALLKKMNLE